MTRVLVLGAIVAVGGGTLAGFSLAYGLTALAVVSIVGSLGGAVAVALITPDPAPEAGLVTLTGPLARHTADADHEDDADEESVPENGPVLQPVVLPVPAAVPNAA